MPPPAGIPEWVYPGTRVRMRSSSHTRPSVWRIEAVRLGSGGPADLQVCLMPEEAEAPPGWFPVTWVITNCPPVDSRDARYVSVDVIRNAVETHNLIATANGNGWVTLRATGSEVVRVGHIQVSPVGDTAVFCPEFQGAMMGEMDPVPVLVAFDGGPAQRFNIIGMTIEDTLRVTLEQEPNDSPVITVGARVTFGRTSDSIRWATVTLIDQLRQIATIQYDGSDEEDDVPIPRLLSGMANVETEVEVDHTPFISPDWLHEGRVLAVPNEHYPSAFPFDCGLRGTRFVIEEIFTLQDGVEPLVRVRSLRANDLSIHLGTEILAWTIPTDEEVPTDGETLLSDAAHMMMRELPNAVQRLTDATTTMIRSLAASLRDVLGPTPRIPPPPPEPEGPRRSIWERLNDDDAFGE